MKAFLVGCVGLFALEGCLSSNYQVSHAELERVGRLPPEVRGERLRVLQQTTLREDEVDWEHVDDEPSGGSESSSSVNVSAGRGAREVTGVHGAAPHNPATSVAWGPKHAGSVRAPVHAGSSSGSSGGSWGGGGGGDASEAIVMAVIAAVIANGAGVALAGVERRRFDGWARVTPDEWLLLVRPEGNEWLPLSALTVRAAATAERAVIVDHDANVLRLDRAPLDRKGLAYEVELGTAVLNTMSGTRDYGFALVRDGPQ